MIRFLVFLLIILSACMVLLGATGSKSHASPADPTVQVSSVQNQPASSAPNAGVTFTVNWTQLNMVFISKILVLAVIVLMAVMNYISFLQKKEEY